MTSSGVQPSTGGDKDKTKKENGESENDALSIESLRHLMSTNQYNTRRMAAQALTDLSLLMANISQLRTLLTVGYTMENFTVLVSLVVISLSLQLLFAVLIFIIFARENDQNKREDFLKTLSEMVKARHAETGVDKSEARNSFLAKKQAYEESRVTSHLNQATIILVFVITVINMFINGFGLKVDTTTSDTTTTNE